MHNIFKISSAHIQSLNDTQTRELVARLCKAELTSKKIGTSPVTWGGDQRAKDGGVDVRIEILPTTGIEGYIPKGATAYQVKAERFGKAKILKEMAPKQILRDVIVELAKQSGAYIIVSTKDSLSDSSLIERKKAMLDCMAMHELAGKVHLDFYDSRKIADWAENHPSIATWVKQESGSPLDGWRPYGPWAYNEQNTQEEYLVDDKIKVVIPDSEDGIDITKAVNRIRAELGSERKSIRIIGLSGVGKTRFVQALFDKRIITTNSALNQENVLYTDLADNPSPQPIAMLGALASIASDSVVVIDNCGQDIHQKLTEIVKQSNSKLRLITIEYDIRDDLPEDTSCYRLEGSSDEVISELLKRRYRTLSNLDIEKITEFSDGNARVAFALASTSETKGQLAKLGDSDLFQRLFVQKNSTNNELLRCAEAASLLYSFDGENLDRESEAALISSVTEITAISFLRNIAELKQRGLVQARGIWRAILPHAISNRLAYAAIETYPIEWLSSKFILQASERIAKSFSRRIGYLHESKNAQVMVEGWLKPDGFLGDLVNLDDMARQIFKNIAPINQQATLSALLRAVKDKDFVSISNVHRAHFAGVIKSLAYEADLFEHAATALTIFALQEPNNYRSNSIGDVLKSLFYIHLSGTHALPQQRVDFVKRLALSGEEAKEKLALSLLSAALQTDHFSCDCSFNFGARKRDYGWNPRTQNDIKNWFKLFIELVVIIAEHPTSIGPEVLSVLGSAFRGLWTQVNMHETLTDAARKFIALRGWPDGWIGVRNTLIWDKDTIDDESLQKLKLLERELAPNDLLSEIHARVLSRGSFSEDIDESQDENRYQKSRKNAEKLGKAAAHDERALSDLTPYISQSKSTDKSWNFGYGIGQEIASVANLLNRVKPIVKEIGHSNLNSIFIRGVIAGWKKNNIQELSMFLDKAIIDEVWCMIFPELQVNAGLDAIAVQRLIASLKLGKAPVWQFSYIGMGRATDPLSVEQVASLLNLIAVNPDNGISIAIDILYMVIHCTDKKNDEYKLELRKFCLKFLKNLPWLMTDIQNNNIAHNLHEIINFLLLDKELHREQSLLLEHIIRLERSSDHYPRRIGNLLLPFFKQLPIFSLNYCYVQELDGGYDIALRIISNATDNLANTAISGVDEESLLEWCASSPLNKYFFAARACRLFEKINSGGADDPENLKISNISVQLLKFSPDKKLTLNIFLNRLRPNHWSGLLSKIMHKRLEMLDQLNPGSDNDLRQLIAEAKSYFSEIIDAEEQREQLWEKSRTGSFE